MTENVGLIYCIENIITHLVYIGKTILKLENRIHDHFSPWSNCRKLKEAITIYGRDNFKISILENNIPYSELDLKESFYIKEFNSIQLGYNIKEDNSKFRGREIHNISKEIKFRIVEDYKQGISPIQIAEHFKVGLTSIYNTLSEYNILKKYNKGGFNSKSKIDLHKLIQFKRLGKGTKYISLYFGVALSSVKRFVNRHKDIIFPRVSDTSAYDDGGENVL